MASKNSSKSGSGAKRGRTESTGSPTERAPNPGRAKLRDWMRQIEAKMTAQASEIEALQKTVRQLHTEVVLNSASASCLQERKEMKFQSSSELAFAETKLRTNFQANINEMTETIQISGTKKNASISELRGTFDMQNQVAAESMAKKIKDSQGCQGAVATALLLKCGRR